jgi:predicted glycosyltransferase
MSAPRILFYVQHLLGIGHRRRAMILAEAMRETGLAVTLVSGGMADEGEKVEGIAVVQLPPVRAGDAELRTIIDAAGRPLDDAFRARRREQLLAALAATAPAAVVLESYPFGRRAFRFELEPLLAAARAMRPRPIILSSIRDVLVAKSDPLRAANVVEAVRRGFDGVLVHGDPRLIRLEESFPAAAALGDKLFYTGYVARAAEDGDVAGTGDVLVSAGGGAVGARLLGTALAARPLTSLADTPWRLVTGPNLAASAFGELAATAPAGVTVERYRPDLPAMMRRCVLSISQAGYNTVLDLIAARARAVVVPFAQGSETEQQQRAERLASRGLLTLLRESELDPSRLAAAIATALAAPPLGEPPVDLDGARRSAETIHALLGGVASLEQQKA